MHIWKHVSPCGRVFSVSDLGGQFYDLKSLKPKAMILMKRGLETIREKNYIHFYLRVMIIAITKNSYPEASINVSTKPCVQGLKEINKYLMMALYRHSIIILPLSRQYGFFIY